MDLNVGLGNSHGLNKPENHFTPLDWPLELLSIMELNSFSDVSNFQSVLVTSSCPFGYLWQEVPCHFYNQSKNEKEVHTLSPCTRLNVKLIGQFFLKYMLLSIPSNEGLTER